MAIALAMDIPTTSILSVAIPGEICASGKPESNTSSSVNNYGLKNSTWIRGCFHIFNSLAKEFSTYRDFLKGRVFERTSLKEKAIIIIIWSTND